MRELNVDEIDAVSGGGSGSGTLVAGGVGLVVLGALAIGVALVAAPAVAVGLVALGTVAVAGGGIAASEGLSTAGSP